MLRNRLVTLALASSWLGVGTEAATAGSCAELEGAKPQAQLEYLQRDRSTLTAACIAYAADQIGLRQYIPAVKTLVAYLDDRLPADPRLQFVGHKTAYPATTALSAA